MSGMYVHRDSSPGLGWSISELPIIAKALQIADSATRSGIEFITQKYAEYVRVQRDAPAMVADAKKIVSTLDVTGTPEQRLGAQRYLAAALDAQKHANASGPVDQVVNWLATIKSQLGLGFIVAVPVWIAGLSVVAALTIRSAIASWSDGRTIRTALAAGFTPEQIAKIGTGQGLSLPEGIASATRAAAWLAAILGGLYIFKTFAPNRR